MKITDIQKLIQGKQYDFLRTNPHLGDKIILLTLGGSHAYGTNTEQSDVDVRGCALNSATDLIGLSEFEQVVHTETDTTIYGFNKLINLLMNCNPNTIEMLGCKPEHYLYLNDIGKQMIDNRKLFLSQRAAYSFGGYATQQLRRLESALARDKWPQHQKEEYIRKSMDNALADFRARYENFDYGKLHIFTDVSNREDFNREIYCDIDLKHFPVRDFNAMMNVVTNVVRSYDKDLNHRNKKKDDRHLNKHAAHLVRLYLMCFDILEKEEINTYRDESEFLLSIINGAFQNPDGTYRQDFFDQISDFEKRLQYAKKNTNLPERPNAKLVEDFVMDVNRRTLGW